EPERVWIACAGNGARALDLRMEVEILFREDAVIYLDYPGYGKCEGSARPSRILESIRAVWPLAAQELGLSAEQMRERGRFFGHSLGAAVALMAGNELKLNRGVLIAPFTSTMDMAQVTLKLPLGFLVWHRFDNVKALKGVCSLPGANVHIIHGDEDEVIP